MDLKFIVSNYCLFQLGKVKYIRIFSIPVTAVSLLFSQNLK